MWSFMSMSILSSVCDKMLEVGINFLQSRHQNTKHHFVPPGYLTLVIFVLHDVPHHGGLIHSFCFSVWKPMKFTLNKSQWFCLQLMAHFFIEWFDFIDFLILINAHYEVLIFIHVTNYTLLFLLPSVQYFFIIFWSFSLERNTILHLLAQKADILLK